MRLSAFLFGVALLAQTPTPRLPMVDSRSYQWTRVNGSTSASVTGDLSVAGAGKVLTLASCPAGLATGNAVYVSAGVGTAEAASITAFTCPFAQSGTITITTANSHTGAYQVSSATAGIDEALVGAGAQRGVQMPSGVLSIYGTIHMTQAYALVGTGPQSTRIVPNFTTVDALDVSSNGVEGFILLSNFSIDFPANQTLGSAISITNKDKAYVTNVFIRNPWVGIDFSAAGGTVIGNFTNIEIVGTVGARGIRANGNISHGLFIDGLIISGVAAGQIGIELGALNSGSVIQNFSIQGGAVNIKVDPGTQYANEVTIANGIFDSYTSAGLQMTGAAPGTGTGWTISNLRVSGVGGANVGFDVNSIYKQVSIFGITGGGVGGGLVCRGCQNLAVGPNFQWSGDGSALAANIGIDIQADGATVANRLTLHDSVVGFSDSGTTTGNILTVAVRISAVAHTNLEFMNNQFYGSFAQIVQDSGTGNSTRFIHNRGLEDVLYNVASAASVTAANGWSLYNISGTTTISNILPGTGAWIGRTITFFKNDAGSVLLSGGNIQTPVTLPQNGRLELVFDGTNWHPTPDGVTTVINAHPVADNVTLFKNFTDGTKLAKLDLSTLTTATTRTYTLPDGNGTFFLRELAQTVTGQTTFSVNVASNPVGFIKNPNLLGEATWWFQNKAAVNVGAVGLNVAERMYIGTLNASDLQFFTGSSMAWIMDGAGLTGDFIPQGAQKLGSTTNPVALGYFTQIGSPANQVTNGYFNGLKTFGNLNVGGTTTWPNLAAGVSAVLSCPATQAIKSITTSAGGVTAVACGVP